MCTRSLTPFRIDWLRLADENKMKKKKKKTEEKQDVVQVEEDEENGDGIRTKGMNNVWEKY